MTLSSVSSDMLLPSASLAQDSLSPLSLLPTTRSVEPKTPLNWPFLKMAAFSSEQATLTASPARKTRSVSPSSRVIVGFRGGGPGRRGRGGMIYMRR